MQRQRAKTALARLAIIGAAAGWFALGACNPAGTSSNGKFTIVSNRADRSEGYVYVTIRCTQSGFCGFKFVFKDSSGTILDDSPRNATLQKGDVREFWAYSNAWKRRGGSIEIRRR